MQAQPHTFVPCVPPPHAHAHTYAYTEYPFYLILNTSPHPQELEEEYDKARSVLKDALRAANWTATPDSEYTDYLEALTAAGGGSDGSSGADKDAEAAAKPEGGEDAAAADDDDDGDTAMADGDEAKGSKGEGSKGGAASGLAAKVAAIRDSHKRVYFEEQVRRCYRGAEGGGGGWLVHVPLAVDRPGGE